jgi:hypothetical protein
MFKRYFLFVPPAVWALILLCASCAGPFSIPTGVTVKGSPSIEAPLGSYEFYLSDIFGPKDIQKSMGGGGDDGGSDLAIYEYTPPKSELELDAKTYLLHYSIPPVEIDMDIKDQFNFDMTPVTKEVTIPELDPHSGGSITIRFPGSQPAHTPVPIPAGTPSVEINMEEDDENEFIKAKVKDGYLSLRANSNSIDFTQTKLTVEAEGESYELTNPQQNGSDWRYLLAEKNIYKSSTIRLGGKIGTGNMSRSEITVTVTPFITELSSITVKITDTDAFDSIDTAVDATGIEWLDSVHFNKTGLNLAFSPRIDGLMVNVNAPDFGFGGEQETTEDNYATGLNFPGAGIDFSPGNNYGVTTTITPKADGVTIYGDDKQRLLVGKSFTITATPSSLFDWKKARIIPGKFPGMGEEDEFGATFPDGEGLDLSALTEELGSTAGADLRFHRIKLNLYLDGPGKIIEKINLALTANWTRDAAGAYSGGPSTIGNEIANDAGAPLVSKLNPNAGSVPVFGNEGVYAGKLPAPDYQNEADITRIFKQSPGDLNLTYEITFSDAEFVEIEKTEGQKSLSIKPDIVLELPLQFEVAAEGSADYAAIKLPLADFMSDDDDDEEKPDMFGRSDPGAGEAESEENMDYIDQIRSAGLKIRYQNTLLNASLYLTHEGPDGPDGEPRFEPKPIFLAPEAGRTDPLVTELDLNIAEELKYPFSPAVEVRIPAEGGAGVLTIRPDTPEEKAGINMLSISATVKTDLDFSF